MTCHISRVSYFVKETKDSLVLSTRDYNSTGKIPHKHRCWRVLGRRYQVIINPRKNRQHSISCKRKDHCYDLYADLMVRGNFRR